MKTWFQNRRMKEKRQQREEEQSRGFCLPTGGVDIAQLAAFGICPPPYQISSPNVTNQSFRRLPSPVNLTLSNLPYMSSPNGNTGNQALPNAHFIARVDNALSQKLPGTSENVHRNNSRDTLSSYVSAQGLAVPMALYPGRQSLPNMGISPNPANYRSVNQARSCLRVVV